MPGMMRRKKAAIAAAADNESAAAAAAAATRAAAMKLSVSVSKATVPHYFRCPISLELMRDPVTVSTGQTYERGSIEKWVAEGNTTCPATMQRLSDLTLIPNHTLRRLIQQWCAANHARCGNGCAAAAERPPTPKQPPDPRAVAALVAAADWTRLAAVAADSDRSRAAVAASPAGAAAAEVALSADSPLPAAEGALALLVALPADAAAVPPPGISPEAAAVAAARLLLAPTGETTRVNAAALVERLAAGSEAAAAALGGHDGVMAGLVALLRERPQARGARAAVRALFPLLLCARSPAACREAAVAAGMAAPLVEHLPEASGGGDTDRTLGCLELLCRCDAGRAAVGGHALAAPALVGAILRSKGGGGQAAECAAGTLLSICSASDSARRSALQSGLLPQLLLLIQSGCTDRAKRKAVELLKLLRPVLSHDPCLLAALERTGVAAF